jgi:hypothetical protein
MRKILIFYILIFSAFSFSVTLAVETKKEIKNKNGKANTWAYYDDNNKPVRIESDRNNDGKIDLWIFYGKNGTRVTQIDMNFDSRPDMYSYYQYGQRVKLEIDTDYDGKLNQINDYIDGRPVKMQKANKNGALETVFDITNRFSSKKKDSQDNKADAQALGNSKTLSEKQKAQ